MNDILRRLPEQELNNNYLGWYHIDEMRNHHLCVGQSSGESRKIKNEHFIMTECLKLFFPNGKSKYGDLKDMELKVVDYKFELLQKKGPTLGELRKRAKLPFINFFLHTIPKKHRLDDNSANDQNENENSHRTSKTISSTSQESASLHLSKTFDKPRNYDNYSEDPNSSSSKSQREIFQKLTETLHTPSPLTVHFVSPSLNYTDRKLEFTREFENVLKKRQVDVFVENVSLPDPLMDSFVEVTITPNCSLLAFEPREFEIVVHRGQVLRELIKIFKENPDVDFSTDIITAIIILPNGEREHAYDSGGVLRDVLTEFWEDFYEQCTTGSNIKIPCLRHDMGAADWKAVGTIIVLGWTLQKILPIRLAPNFLKSALYGISSDKLREEFLQFVPQCESMLLSSALENIENVEMDELLDVLSTHGCKVKVTKHNLGTVIDQIAHLEMVQKPTFIRECLFEVLKTYELIIDVDNEFQKITPTSKKLILSLECEDSESISFRYFKRYIREIDQDNRMLRTLLRFLTASDLMLCDSDGTYFKIKVNIVDLVGIARRPVAHTCGRILDLPRKYNSYASFKSELNAVLSSNIWVMDLEY